MAPFRGGPGAKFQITDIRVNSMVFWVGNFIYDNLFNEKGKILLVGEGKGQFFEKMKSTLTCTCCTCDFFM